MKILIIAAVIALAGIAAATAQTGTAPATSRALNLTPSGLTSLTGAPHYNLPGTVPLGQ